MGVVYGIIQGSIIGVMKGDTRSLDLISVISRFTMTCKHNFLVSTADLQTKLPFESKSPQEVV